MMTVAAPSSRSRQSARFNHSYRIELFLPFFLALNGKLRMALNNAGLSSLASVVSPLARARETDRVSSWRQQKIAHFGSAALRIFLRHEKYRDQFGKWEEREERGVDGRTDGRTDGGAADPKPIDQPRKSIGAGPASDWHCR